MQALNMVRLVGLLICLLTANTTQAQAPAWQWAFSPGIGEGISTAVDAAGNVYVTGGFNCTVSFGATTLINDGGPDVIVPYGASPGNADNVYVAKLVSSGACQWAVALTGNFDGRGSAKSYSLAVDSSGAVYVTGNFRGVILVGNTRLTAAEWGSVFVAKLNPAGEWLWAVSAGIVGEGPKAVPETDAISVDTRGNAYVAGRFRSSGIAFGSIQLTKQFSGDQYEMFVAKVTPAGTWQWARSAQGITWYRRISLAVDPNRNVIVAGSLYDDADFGPISLKRSKRTFQQDGFVAKLSAEGQWQWARRTGGKGDDYVRGIAADRQGNIYLTGGQESATMRFGSTRLVNQDREDCAAGVSMLADIFVAKLSPDGAWRWAVGAGGTGYDESLAIAIDGKGNVYVAGKLDSVTTFGDFKFVSPHRGAMVVATLNKVGEWQWALASTWNCWIGATGLAVAESGIAYVTGGYMRTSARFGKMILPAPVEFYNSSIFIGHLAP